VKEGISEFLKLNSNVGVIIFTQKPLDFDEFYLA
jgi:hypothetical protein